jgi:histidyl-tRNA synthetase
LTIRAVKGTRDLLPDETPAWHAVEAAARELMPRYGYREIRTPVFEETELFARGIGADTDIVGKEMYTFPDRDGASLTLRPEATAGIVRAAIEHSLFQSDPALKVWAMGPMFRREQPQKGRYRQFHQLDVEAFGLSSPASDAEVIELAVAYVETCGVGEHEVVLNSVGDAKCRPAYVKALRQALEERASRLCADCQRRAQANPLRVLDCKVAADQPVIDALPRITDHLCAECQDHFAEVRRLLERLGIPARLNPRLVRGLDYYVRTTFEVTSGRLGAQNSLLGGGRYDGLVRDLGGPDVAGTGFALGMERLVLLQSAAEPEPRCDVFLLPLAAAGIEKAVVLQRELRRAGVRVMLDAEGRSVKARMKLADRLGARRVALLGEDELKKGVWTVRDMAGSAQQEVPEAQILEHLREKTGG